jgi:hypothetical protein
VSVGTGICGGRQRNGKRNYKRQERETLRTHG